MCPVLNSMLSLAIVGTDHLSIYHLKAHRLEQPQIKFSQFQLANYATLAGQHALQTIYTLVTAALPRFGEL